MQKIARLHSPTAVRIRHPVWNRKHVVDDVPWNRVEIVHQGAAVEDERSFGWFKWKEIRVGKHAPHQISVRLNRCQSLLLNMSAFGGKADIMRTHSPMSAFDPKRTSRTASNDPVWGCRMVRLEPRGRNEAAQVYKAGRRSSFLAAECTGATAGQAAYNWILG